MHDQLLHLLTRRIASTSRCRSCRPRSARTLGLLGGFAIASFDNAPGTVYMESPDQGQTTELPSVVAKISRTFDTLRADALPRGASRDLIGKVAEERWATCSNATWRKSSYSGSNGGELRRGRRAA